MSYKQGMIELKAHNRYHTLWQRLDTGKWEKDFDSNNIDWNQKSRRVDNPEEEWDWCAELPHSCDAWEIGDVDAMKVLIADLEAAIVEMEAKT
jgi:hypothetical protein